MRVYKHYKAIPINTNKLVLRGFDCDLKTVRMVTDLGRQFDLNYTKEGIGEHFDFDFVNGGLKKSGKTICNFIIDISKIDFKPFKENYYLFLGEQIKINFEYYDLIQFVPSNKNQSGNKLYSEIEFAL
jgi:hypothetical protein